MAQIKKMAPFLIENISIVEQKYKYLWGLINDFEIKTSDEYQNKKIE